MSVNPIRQHSTIVHQRPPTASDEVFRDFLDSTSIHPSPPFCADLAVEWLYS